MRILIVNFVFFALFFSYQVGGTLLTDDSFSFGEEYNTHIVEEYRFNSNEPQKAGLFTFVRKEQRRGN